MLPENPITRNENYLGVIAGQEGAELPEYPITREDQYLDFIARNGTAAEREIREEVGTLSEEIADVISGKTPVELAVNLTTDDTINDTKSWLRRTTAGDASIANGKCTVRSVAGNNSMPIHTQGAATVAKTETETASIVFADPGTLTEESYYLSYDGTDWKNGDTTAALADYGITLTGTAYSGDSISITKTEGVYSATYNRANRLTMSFTLATWLHKAELDGTALGSYVFTYDDGWKLDGAAVTLADYGIGITGTAVDGDNITVSYTAASDYGHIDVTTPTAVVSTGINSYSGGNNFNPASVLEGYTIDASGNIVAAAGKSVGFAWCVDGTNGWIVGHRQEIDRVAFSATIPTAATTGMTVLAKDDSLSSEGAYDGQAYYNDGYNIPAEGYIVFCGSDINLVNSHPRWSGRANWIELGNTDYMPYTETVVDLIGKPFTRNITRVAYTAAALDALLEEHTDWVKNVDYAWDNDYIYHVSVPVSGTYAADSELWSVGSTRDTVDVLTDSVANDYGVEELRGTTRAAMVTIVYLANLKNQLRHAVRYDGQVLTPAQQASAQETLGVGMKFASTLPANAAVNTIYSLGTVDAVTTALPNGTKVGDMVSIIWYNGATPATVTITGQILPFSFTPTASMRSEVSAMWDGANWSLVAYEQAVVV